MLNFAGGGIPGIHGPVVPDPSEFEGQSTKYFGLEGESEIIGNRGGRKITVPILIYDVSFFDERGVFDFLKELDAAIGTNGMLIETGTCTGEWDDVTFKGFVQDPMGRLPDVGMMLSPNKDTVAWFCKGVLHFYQNSYNTG